MSRLNEAIVFVREIRAWLDGIKRGAYDMEKTSLDHAIDTLRLIENDLVFQDEKNPSLVTYANPPEEGALMSENVYQVRYRHAENDKDYFHDFADGVAMIALDNGGILLKSDKVLWEDFD